MKLVVVDEADGRCWSLLVVAWSVMKLMVVAGRCLVDDEADGR